MDKQVRLLECLDKGQNLKTEHWALENCAEHIDLTINHENSKTNRLQE